MSARGSACGRRGPSPTVLGRPAPDDQHTTQAARSGSSRLKSEWVRPWSVARLVIPDIRF
jgi:hypothetical protein